MKPIQVQLLGLDGTVLHTYKSIQETATDFKVDESTIRQVIKEKLRWRGYYLRRADSDPNKNSNVNEVQIKEFDKYIEKLGINKDEIKSVKFWQTQSGDLRYSIVKNFEDDLDNKEDFYKLLKTSLIKEVKPFTSLKIELPENAKRALIIHMSDKHVGADTTDRALYGNEYNEAVFASRMHKVLQEIAHLRQFYGVFDTIIINDLGDPLDGYDGFTTRRKHPLKQNMHSSDAFDVYVRVHRKFFDFLVGHGYGNHIRFYAVSNDNHSGAFGYCANRALEIYLNVKYPQIETKIMKKFIEHFYYGDHAFMLCHGKDDEDMSSGFPLKLDAKTENLISNYIDYNELKSKHNHFIKGDLHQSASQITKKFRYRGVLSMYGGSKWIHHNFGSCNAGVSYEIVSKTENRILEGNIMF